MTQIVLNIENELDIEPIIAIAQRLHIEYFTNKNAITDDFTSKNNLRIRQDGLKKFAGILKNKKSYIHSKSEFYEQ